MKHCNTVCIHKCRETTRRLYMYCCSCTILHVVHKVLAKQDLKKNFSTMSELDKAMCDDAQKRLKTGKGIKQKPRLIADKTIGVAQIGEIIVKYCEFKQSKDLHSLLCPASAIKISWKMKLLDTWIVKMAGICYELAAIAPNTKLNGSKVRKAIEARLQQGDIKNNTELQEKDFVDACDMMIRVALQQYRCMKQDMKAREIVMKKLDREDRRRVTLVLDRMLLPPVFEESTDEEENEVRLWNSENTDSQSSVQHALVPAEVLAVPADAMPQPTVDFDVSAFESIASDEGAEQVLRTPPRNSTVGFSSPEKPTKGRPSASSRASFRLSPSGTEVASNSKVHAQGEKRKQPASDAQLLAMADNFVPAAVSNSKPKKKPKFLKKPASVHALKRPAKAEVPLKKRVSTNDATQKKEKKAED